MAAAGLRTLMVAATRECNLHCSYCYNDHNPGRMSLETWQRLMDEASHNFGSDFRVLWHGGEPSLMGADFFSKAVSLEPTGIANLVQTNGTANDEVLATWKELGFAVGLSADFPLSETEQLRAIPAREMEATIVRHDALFGRVGIITVITRRNIRRPSRMLPWLRDRLVKFSPVFTTSGLSPTPQQYASFLQFWGKRYPHTLSLRHLEPVRSLVLSVLTEEPQICCFQANCQQHYLAVDANGDLYPCIRFLGHRAFCYGTLKNGIAAALSSPLYHRFMERTERLRSSRCGRCRWFSVCFGGCAFNGGLDNPDPFCLSYRRFRDWFADWLEKQGAIREDNLDETALPVT